MKRPLVVLLTGAMIAFLLAACGGDTTTPTSSRDIAMGRYCKDLTALTAELKLLARTLESTELLRFRALARCMPTQTGSRRRAMLMTLAASARWRSPLLSTGDIANRLVLTRRSSTRLSMHPCCHQSCAWVPGEVSATQGLRQPRHSRRPRRKTTQSKRRSLFRARNDMQFDPSGPDGQARSWKVEVRAVGEAEFHSNLLRFGTRPEAEAYGAHLADRWLRVEEHRFVESPNPVTYAIRDSELVRIKPEPPGDTQP